MMLLLLKKKLLSPTSCKSLPLRCLSSSSPDLKPHFMKGYLITSCGLPPDKAAKVAKHLIRIKSPEKPDSVISFLKHWGFDETHIRRLVSRYPAMLSCNIENLMKPNMKTLFDMGFSRPDLPRVVIENPRLLVLGEVLPRIDFWRGLLGNDNRKLRLVLQRNRNLINCDITSSVTSKFAILKNHGLSDRQIQSLLLLGSSVFKISTNSIELLLKWVADLGISVDSPCFIYALNALGRCGKAQFKAKKELLTKYGWSEKEFLSLFEKCPSVTCLSQRNIQDKMEFLVERAGYMPDYIARHPEILQYSLEKRTMPRNHILQILKAKGLADMHLHHIMQFTDKKFSDKCIHPFEGKVPELSKSYTDACAGRFHLHPSTPSQ